MPRLTLVSSAALAIAVPWAAALLIMLWRRHVRWLGAAAALLSLAACGLEARLPGPPLVSSLMLLFAALALSAILLLPRRDCTPAVMAGLLFLLGATLLAYAATNLLVLLAGWLLSLLPFLLPRWLPAHSWRPRAALLLSTLALGLAVARIGASAHSFALAGMAGHAPGGVVAFALLLAAVILRKGILPAHAWVADEAASGPLVPAALLFSGHLGALLVARLIAPLYAGAAFAHFPLLSYLALATALVVAIRALGEHSPRRLLAWLALSQSAAILAGLESRTPEGVAGALVHWYVVAVSTVALFGILRLLEVRVGENLSTRRHLGLAAHAPRLAVAFAVFSLALVGLPGTLSFCSQDLLTQGALQAHPVAGLLLPLATALNAVSIFRLFSRLFLGRRDTGFTAPFDALPRERWVLSLGMLFVVLGGLLPGLFVASLAHP